MKIKAQITSFIIIGMILLLIISSLVYLTGISKSQINTEQQLDNQDTNPISTFMQSCLQQVSEKSFMQWGLQSGYFNMPEKKLENQPIALYLFDNTTYFPEKDFIKNQLELSIDSNLDNCLNDFQQFREQGFDIEAEELRTVAVIFGNQLNVRLSHKILAKKDSSATEIKDIIIQLPYDFNNIYAILQAINAEQMKNPNAVPIGFLAMHSEQNSFNYNLIYQDNDIVIYSLLFEDKESKQQLLFNFAAKYNWDELK